MLTFGLVNGSHISSGSTMASLVVIEEGTPREAVRETAYGVGVTLHPAHERPVLVEVAALLLGLGALGALEVVRTCAEREEDGHA